MVVLCCAVDDINVTCSDPLGADARTIDTDALSCFQSDFNGCFEFRRNGSSVYLQSVYLAHADPSVAPLIVDVGAVTCLREVIQRPSDGWKYVVTANEKHGYVFKMKDGSLGRLFIDSWETSKNDLTQVRFIRQYPY